MVAEPYNGLPPFVAGSATSEEAALAQEPSAGTKRARIFELIRNSEDGLTDLELEDLTGWQGSTVRPRRRELQLGGHIGKRGDTRETPSHRRAVVWVVAEDAPVRSIEEMAAILGCKVPGQKDDPG